MFRYLSQEKSPTSWTTDYEVFEFFFQRLLSFTKIYPSKQEYDQIIPLTVFSSINTSALYLFHSATLPVCILSWQTKLDLCENLASQKLQDRGLSPVCVVSCLTLFGLLTNLASQKEHAKGFSPRGSAISTE